MNRAAKMMLMNGKSEKPISHKEHYAKEDYAKERENHKLTKETAEAWTAKMENADGTMGAHWTMEQTKQVMAQRGIEHNPIDFYAAMNAVYSDYCHVAKKYNVNTVDFYADMAKAWLDDTDAHENKAAKYYEYIVK